MTELNIPTAEAFKPLEQPSRYNGAWGGRGSGKSWFFAEKLVEEWFQQLGQSAFATQKSLAQSAKALIEAKIQALESARISVR